MYTDPGAYVIRAIWADRSDDMNRSLINFGGLLFRSMYNIDNIF